MNQQTTYKSRPVRSPIQPRPSKEIVDANPVRSKLRELCTGTHSKINLSASFEEDTETMSAVGTEGLLAVRCILRDSSGRALGIGHASSVVSRINRASERLFFGLLNGSLVSACSSAGKTLDALRLGEIDEKYESEKTSYFRSGGPSGEDSKITPKQRAYLLQLASMNMSESDAEHFASTVDDMTRQEASAAIANFAA